MVKRITQPTFDSVVKENMEDFSLNLEDALKEAILQLTQQGITLDNIDITGGKSTDMNELKSSIDTIIQFSKNQSINEDTLFIALVNIRKLCSSKSDNQVRNKNILLREGCLYSLYEILKLNCTLVTTNVLETIIYLTKSDEYRDFFEPGGGATLDALFQRYYECLETNVLQLVLKLGHVVGKSENNKVTLMKSMNAHIITVLTNPMMLDHVTEWVIVIQEACLLLRELCVHNDNRVDMSCAFENGREFSKNSNLLISLTKVSGHYSLHPVLSSCALTAIRTMTTNEETVAAIAKCNITDVLIDILVYFQKRPLVKDEATRVSIRQLIKSCLGLIRNLCVDDNRKAVLVDNSVIEIILYYLINPDYLDDHATVESGIACLANISLRSVPNSSRITELGGITVITACMRKHEAHACLQKQCCAVVRNIAARYPASHSVFLDAGVEPLLRRAGTMSGAVDEAYSALRDLKCDVKMVKIGANGKVENAFETFGTIDETGNIVSGVRKLNFNPVFEETEGLLSTIETESSAPFKTDL